MKKSILIIFAFVIIFTYYHFRPAVNFDNNAHITIAGKNIQVELAVSDEEKSKGLSGKEKLNEDEGMLFVFEEAGRYPFWMKDMNFPIDIIWFTPSEGGADEDLKVIYIKKDARPESYPETFGPDENAKYVLEVVSGFSDKNNLKVGDSVVFNSPL